MTRRLTLANNRTVLFQFYSTTLLNFPAVTAPLADLGYRPALGDCNAEYEVVE